MSRPPSLVDLDAALASVPLDLRRRNPVRPIAELVALARHMLLVVEPHRERFAPLPDFEVALVDRLPGLIERAEQADIAWILARREGADRGRRRLRDEAIALRFELVSAVRYLLRDDPVVQAGFDGFHRRRRLEQIAGDLRRLAEALEANPERFAHAPGLPPRPAEAARALAGKLDFGGGPWDGGQVLEQRNAAAALLTMALQELGSAGRYLFRHEPKLLAQLTDPVARRRRRATRRGRASRESESAA
jgi:hypothetical protein